MRPLFAYGKRKTAIKAAFVIIVILLKISAEKTLKCLAVTRHTYASNCAAANISMYKLMAMLGHKKIDTTMKYYVDTSNETLYERTLKTLDELFTVE